MVRLGALPAPSSRGTSIITSPRPSTATAKTIPELSYPSKTGTPQLSRCDLITLAASSPWTVQITTRSGCLAISYPHIYFAGISSMVFRIAPVARPATGYSARLRRGHLYSALRLSGQQSPLSFAGYSPGQEPCPGQSPLPPPLTNRPG